MTNKIKILPDNLINKIAAGEVVERPASVVKELVENAIDAGATEIRIDIEQSGKRTIKVTDNGSGMSKEDARTAFERHATSKISSEGDLDAIRTMGFRGEALSSIASVAQVRMLTAERGSSSGSLIEIEGGVVRNLCAAAAAGGTSIEVNHLFFNTPARLKFLKSPSTEFSHIIAAVSHQALAYPGIRFRLTHNKKDVLDLPPSHTHRERVFQLQGEELSNNLLEFSGSRDSVQVHGLIAKPVYTRADRTLQEFYVNSRFIRNPSLTHALYDAYRDLLMRDRHPAGFVFIELDPALVDVNVHPAKAEVRFRNQSQIHDLVRDVVREALRGAGLASLVQSISPDAGSQAVTLYAERVKEAIADFGSRIAEYGNEEPYQLQGLSIERTDVNPHSAFRIPQLYPLAQVHDSFIIAQSNDGMALIDQHAAHERVLFEKLQDQYAAGNIPIQDLLIPVQVELVPAEKVLLDEHLPVLRKLGFLIEEFGGTTFMIKAVPALMTGGDYRKLLLDIIDEIKMHGTSGKMDELRDEILSVMACHPAIKVHHALAVLEMERLIDDLFSCRMPHSCPHGRPTVVRFSMDDIKKMFKRI
ncbi:MAG TPA: DNA mismatch repair endonuclease MutL [Nitrospirota bacterium]|nr:DNA mismatch repair endonuclease MutL [Nitrospirota bacterium]